MASIDQKSKAILSDDYQKGVEAARRNVPRWKGLDYCHDSKRQDVWRAGYDDEISGARLTQEVRSNMPEATAPADIVASQAATLLNDDAVPRGALSEQGRSFTIRGATLEWDDGVALRVSHPVAGAATSLGHSFVTPIFREVFFEAARAWHQRRRDELCAPVAKRISNSEPPAPPQSDALPSPPKRSWRGLAMIVVSGVVGLAVVVSGVASCVNDADQRAEVERARASETNRYGFQRGLITSRKVWPDDCKGSGFQSGNDYGSGREFQSVYECRGYWERWEREGKIWIDWKSEPAQ